MTMTDEPIEFTTWWEATMKLPDNSTSYAMRQVALVGWIEGRNQGYAEALREASK